MGTLVTCTISIIIALIGATWALSSKLNAVRSDVTKEVAGLRSEIGELRTELAVMKESEKRTAEKTEQMWKWWLTSIERGWMSHMESQVERSRTMGAGQ